jgi:hypothetical protein
MREPSLANDLTQKKNVLHPPIACDMGGTQNLGQWQRPCQPEGQNQSLSVIKIKSAPHRWSVPAAHASGEWLFGCIEPGWIAIDNSM